MSIGLGISIFIFLIILIAPSINWDNDAEVYMMTEVALDSPPEIDAPMLQSKPSKAIAQESKTASKNEKQVKTDDLPRIIKDTQEEPVRNADANPIDTTQKVAANQQTNQDSLKGLGNINGEGDLPFDFVDVMPQFPGGQRSLSRFISSKLVYPGTALQNKIEGIVIVGFVIDKSGILRNPKILKSLYPACDEEALRVVRLIPDWIPAKNQGRNVSINFKMPIEFKLIR